ncbi:hypothetical protein M0R45_012089 [Rubus argutus]|uniref:Uncharacterized protein n=1 Tax=Rubus argutus TaxID=59490 RepID=A0AAW1YD98_RUBAR
MEKAMIWVLVSFVIASCVPLFSRFPEAEALELCHKNADCRRSLCELCVNGVCTCEVSRDESVAAPKAHALHHFLDQQCSNVSDCEHFICLPEPIGLHVDCVDGNCVCVR